MKQPNHNRLGGTLRQIQLRTQVALKRHLTYADLALIAGVQARLVGDWMRGTSSPVGMSAVLDLLAELPSTDTEEILKDWRDAKASKTKIKGKPSSRTPNASTRARISKAKLATK